MSSTPGSPRRVKGGTAPARNLIGSNATFSSFHSLIALGPPNFSRMGSKLFAPTLNLNDPSGTCITQPSYFLKSILSASPMISRICYREGNILELFLKFVDNCQTFTDISAAAFFCAAFCQECDT